MLAASAQQPQFQGKEDVENAREISQLASSLARTSIASSQESSSLPSLEGGRGKGSSASRRKSSASSSASSESEVSTPSSTESLSNSVALLVHNEKTAKELLAESRRQQQQQQQEKELEQAQSPGWSQSFALHKEWPRPNIKSPDELLISVKSVGLNPVDYKCVQYGFGIEEWPAVIGRDVAGVVEEIGSQVKNFKVGDRVWTCADSRDVRAGAYQTYSVAKADTVGRVPDGVACENAATIGTGLVTAAIALYWFFGIPRATALGGGPIPRRGDREAESSSQALEKAQQKWIIIYGGGAITGIYISQLARLSGLKVLTVASRENFEYLTSLGASKCVDRHQSSEEISNEIKEATGGRLAYAIDCVGSETAGRCQRFLEEADGAWIGEGQMIALAGNPKKKEEDTIREGKKREVKIHTISFSKTFYGDSVFSTALLSDLYSLLNSGDLVTARPEVIPGGLAGVRQGLESLSNGSAPRAKKLVVRVVDTPLDDHHFQDRITSPTPST